MINSSSPNKYRAVPNHPKVVDILNPKDTVLYQFALGVSDILVSDPSVASECQVHSWKVDQPSIQKGTAQWFKQLEIPLKKLKHYLDTYALQPVCEKDPARLKIWLYKSLAKEKERHDNLVKKKLPYKNINVEDSYGDITHKIKLKKKAKKRKNFLATSSKTGTKDWFAVLKLSLPKVPYNLLKYKMVLDKMMKGFLLIQFNEFIDCVGKQPETGRSINNRIVGYRLLMIYFQEGKTTKEFGNVISYLLCNWNRFLDHINTVIKANLEKDEKKKWFLYGQAMGKLVVALATGNKFETLYKHINN